MNPLWTDEELKPTIEDFLSEKPPVSPPVKIQIGTNRIEVAFRTLSDQQLQWITLQTRKYVHEQMELHKLPKEDIDTGWVLDIAEKEYELEMLQAACLNPKYLPEKHIPIFPSLDNFRKTITGMQRIALNKHFWVWQNRHTPGGLNEQEIKELIDSVKKKGMSSEQLIKYGVDGLLICITILGEQLRNYQIEKSSDGSSGTEDSMMELQHPESNWPNLYMKFSERLDSQKIEIEFIKKQIMELTHGN